MRTTFWILVAALLALAMMAGIAGGQKLEARWPGGYVVPPERAGTVSLEVVIDGHPLRTIRHAGKTYLPVPWLGEEYALRVRNSGTRRVLAIVSVDGLSVISGKPASPSGMGYVIEPGTAITIEGWRRSLGHVATFRFTSREDSYAARMGHPENVGVIGLVAIEERHGPPHPLALKSEGKAMPSRGALDAAAGGTGTGYGRDIGSPAYVVPFERGRVIARTTLYYDTADALRRAGVPVDGRYPVPFPAPYEFAPPPPGR